MVRRIIVVVCFMALAIALALTARTRPVINEMAAVPGDNDARETPAIASITSGSEEQRAADNSDKKQTYEKAAAMATVAQAAYAEAQTILALFALLFTVVLCWVAFGEWSLNQKTLAMTTAIERAWIGVTEIRLYDFEANKPLRVGVEFKNTGNTPAYIKHVKIRVDIIGKDRLPQLPTVPDYGSNVDALMVEAVLMPGEVSTTFPDYSGLPVLQPFVVRDVRARNANLYVYGCVVYRDSLMPDSQRMTKFARRYDGPDSAANGRDVFYFPKLPGYNEAT